jgi:hypothetical protein
MKKLFFIVTLFLMSFATFAQELDIRTGIDFQTDDTVKQRNFVNEAYFTFGQAFDKGFSGNVSLQWDGSQVNLYTGNIQYQKYLGTNKVNFTLGKFENSFYRVETQAWRNLFVSQTVSNSLFNRTGTGLEATFESRFIDFSASTTSQDNNLNFTPENSNYLFSATVRPHPVVSLTGVLYRTENKNANFGGLVSFNKTFKRIGNVNFGVEFLTTSEKTLTTVVGKVTDVTTYRDNNYSTWLEVAPKVWKGKVSVFGRYDTQDLNTGYYNATVGLLCRPVDEVTLGLIYNKACGLVNAEGNRVNTNTIGLNANIVFMNLGWF